MPRLNINFRPWSAAANTIRAGNYNHSVARDKNHLENMNRYGVARVPEYIKLKLRDERPDVGAVGNKLITEAWKPGKINISNRQADRSPVKSEIFNF